MAHTELLEKNTICSGLYVNDGCFQALLEELEHLV